MHARSLQVHICARHCSTQPSTPCLLSRLLEMLLTTHLPRHPERTSGWTDICFTGTNATKITHFRAIRNLCMPRHVRWISRAGVHSHVDIWHAARWATSFPGTVDVWDGLDLVTGYEQSANGFCPVVHNCPPRGHFCG